MLKLSVAILFAVIAALIIFIAGLVSEARMVTIALRSLAGFTVTALVVWLIAFILEAKNIIGLDKSLVEIIAEEDRAQAEAEAEAASEQELAAEAAAGEDETEAGAVADEPAPVAEEAPAETTEEAAGQGFAPLQPESLTRVEAS